MDNSSFPFIASTALGLTFLASGLSKLQDRKGFVLGVLEYQVLPPRLAILYGQTLPFIEVLSGLALVLGVLSTIAGLISAALLLSFSIAVAINLARRRLLDCHCFGSAQGEHLGWLTVIRLCLLLTLAAVVIRNRGNEFFAPIPENLVPGNLLPSLLLASGIFLGIYLLSFFPTVWRIWSFNVARSATPHSSRVSLRGLPVNQRTPQSEKSFEHREG